MSEEMDGKTAYFLPESALPLGYLFVKVLFPICTLTWRVNNYVTSRENLRMNEDGSPIHSHPEVGVSLSYYSQELGPPETS